MGKKEKSPNSRLSDRKKWQKIFESLVEMLKDQQNQLETLSRERKLLEDRIKSYHDRWVSDVTLCKHHISQMESEINALEKLRKADLAKSNLLVVLKQRDALTCKTRLDSTVDDLKDLKDAFDCVINSENKVENASQISALMSERDFVWNQYKKLESELTQKLNSKKSETEKANEKIRRLLQDMEHLRSSNIEKDNTICKLKSDIAELEAASVEKSREISTLSGELDTLRKARNDSITPILRGCSAASHGGEKKKGSDPRNIIVKKDPQPSQLCEKGSRSSKRKATDTTPLTETPKLFTSAFKVPKLKNSSPHVN